MTRIVIDTEMQRVLGDLSEPLEVCNSDGRVIAYVTPAGREVDYDCASSPHSNDELKRRESEPARPLEDILADLEAHSSAE